LEFGSFYILSSWLGSISADIRPRESQLCLKELAESNLTPLAPLARYFLTANGSFRISRGAVKVDHAWLDTGDDLFCV
jgi:hypothetical protein